MSHTNKALITRLVDDVLNSGRLEVIDELYTPELAPAARRWIAHSGNPSRMYTWTSWS
jgi:hypothetical protein